MQIKLVIALLMVPALAACAASPKPIVGRSTSVQKPIIGIPPEPPSRTRPATNPGPRPAATASGFRPARVMDVPGLEGVIGANEGALTQRFGTPRLTVTEGDVRKLQFSGESCVLDVYLYPPQPGGQPTATYVDARRSSDGLDVDRAACVAAFRGR